jgi:hypothetical protein
MKRVLLTKPLIVLLAFLSLIQLNACSKKDPILGTWQEPVSGITMQFNDDQTLVISRDGTSFTLEYEERNPNIIAITSAVNGEMPVQTMTYQVTEDQLIITVDKVDTIFTRVK